MKKSQDPNQDPNSPGPSAGSPATQAVQGSGLDGGCVTGASLTAFPRPRLSVRKATAWTPPPRGERRSSRFPGAGPPRPSASPELSRAPPLPGRSPSQTDLQTFPPGPAHRQKTHAWSRPSQPSVHGPTHQHPKPIPVRPAHRPDPAPCHAANGGRRAGTRPLPRGMLIRSPPSRARSLLRLKVPRRRRTCGRSRSTCCSSSVSSRSNTSSSHWASRCSRRRSCSACDRCSRAARVSSSSRLSSSWARDSEGGGVSRVRTLAPTPTLCSTEIGETLLPGVPFQP